MPQMFHIYFPVIFSFSEDWLVPVIMSIAAAISVGGFSGSQKTTILKYLRSISETKMVKTTKSVCNLDPEKLAMGSERCLAKR